MFYLSRSLSTDGDFWNSAGLEAFISQQRRIHPADVGGEYAYIPFLILSSSHGNAHASRLKCHLQFQKRRFQVLLYLTVKQSCHWDKALESPHIAFHSQWYRCTALPQPARLHRNSQEMQSKGEIQTTGYILFLQTEVRKRACGSFSPVLGRRYYYLIFMQD